MIWIFAIGGVLAFSGLGWKIALRRTARGLLEEQKTLFARRHQLLKVRPTDFSFLDQEFYRKTTELLQQAGFVHHGDAENVTLTRRFPGMDTFYRLMLGDGGATLARIHHLRARGRRAAFRQRMFGLPLDARIIEFSTELEDGSFLETCNGGSFASPEDLPGISRTVLPENASVEKLLEVHRDSVFAALARRHTRTSPRLNYDKIIRSIQRAQSLIYEHQKKVGYIDTSLILTLDAAGPGSFRRILVKEIEKIKKSKGLPLARPSNVVHLDISLDDLDGVEASDLAPTVLTPHTADREEEQHERVSVEERALTSFEAHTRDGRADSLDVQWERFCNAVHQALSTTRLEYSSVIALPREGSEIGIGRMMGTKPYLCFKKPEASSTLESFRDTYMEGGLYDPPFSRIEAIVAGMDHDQALYILLEFMEEKQNEQNFKLSFDPDWDKPTILYFGSETTAGHAKPVGTRKGI